MASTITAIEREPAGGGLARRWTGARDGGFAICSFWLADRHARAGPVARAREVFGAAAGRADDAGLPAEQGDGGRGPRGGGCGDGGSGYAGSWAPIGS
jgi:GH15 family glucan-1,4-alpha-glucosidase